MSRNVSLKKAEMNLFAGEKDEKWIIHHTMAWNLSLVVTCFTWCFQLFSRLLPMI